MMVRQGSKWTRLPPKGGSKHFEVIEVSRGRVLLRCIVTKEEVFVTPSELRGEGWTPGWL